MKYRLYVTSERSRWTGMTLWNGRVRYESEISGKELPAMGASYHERLDDLIHKIQDMFYSSSLSKRGELVLIGLENEEVDLGALSMAEVAEMIFNEEN